MPDAAFEEAVQRHLHGRSVRAVLRDAGLPGSSIKNMRLRPSMPPASQIDTIAQALGASPATLTRALMRDRGYTLGDEVTLDVGELGAIARSLSPRQRVLLVKVAELIRDWTATGR